MVGFDVEMRHTKQSNHWIAPSKEVAVCYAYPVKQEKIIVIKA
jgi:hypothetical protein